ncbi:hypothetical protein D3C79_300690 [compost metagenome]
MRQGLGNAEEHQADAHAGAEHHGHPGNGPKLGGFAVTPERDLAVTAGGQPQHEHDEQSRSEDEEPAEVENDPGLRRGGTGSQTGLVDEAPDDECDRENTGDAKHDPVDLALETAVLAGLRGFRGVRHAEIERFGDVFLCHE